MHLLLDSAVVMEMFPTCSFCPHHLPCKHPHLKSAAGLLWGPDSSLLSSGELPELRSAAISLEKAFPMALAAGDVLDDALCSLRLCHFSWSPAFPPT